MARSAKAPVSAKQQAADTDIQTAIRCHDLRKHRATAARGFRRTGGFAGSHHQWAVCGDWAGRTEELDAAIVTSNEKAEVADQDRVRGEVELTSNGDLESDKFGWFRVDQEDAVLKPVAVGFEGLRNSSPAGV
jgi:hypothetical protein